MPASWKIAAAFVCLVFLLPFTATVHATTQTDSESPKVTVSIPDFIAPSAPILVAPSNNSHINSPPTFTFKRSTDRDSSITYDLYVDGTLLFADISNTANKLGANYSSSVNTAENTISVFAVPTNLIKEGAHSWKVIAKDAAGNTTDSATWSFILDLTAPYIILNSVGPYTNLSLSSQDPASVPSNTRFQVQGPGYVKFTGATEPSATIQLKVTSSDPNKSKTYTTTATTDGTFSFDIYFELGRHNIELIAVDKAGNTSVLPDFNLIVSKEVPVPPGGPGGMPATLYQVIPPPLAALLRLIKQTPGLQAAILIILLALAVTLLIILVWKRPKNLLLINQATHHPIIDAKIFSPHRTSTTNNHGLVYIPNLQKGTYLAITLPQTSTPLHLCLLQASSFTTLIL